ncbi:MAG: hypothetical protein GY757_47290 [bacterium]|nr:hypothetical protein [bacterium]
MTGSDPGGIGCNSRDLVEEQTSGTGDDLSTTGYTYDGNGRLTIHTDAMDKNYQTIYDNHGRTWQGSDPLGNKVHYEYDVNPVKPGKPWSWFFFALLLGQRL